MQSTSTIKNFFRRFLLLFIYISSAYTCLASTLWAQDLTSGKIRIYNTADGLPHSRVYCLSEDKEGNIWIGTGKGVSKFNSKSFKNYAAVDGITNKAVWRILPCSNGSIWFSSENEGLFRYYKKRWEQFTKRKNGLFSNRFSDGFLYEDSRKNIWAGGRFSNLIKYNHHKFEKIHIKQPFDIVEHKSGQLYLIQYEGSSLYRISKDNKLEIAYDKFDRTRKLYIDNDDNIWVVNGTNYLAKSTDGGVTFEKYEMNANLLGWYCFDLFFDSRNQIWMAYDHTIVRFDGTNFYYYDEKNGLPESVKYFYVFEDRHGHLWFCTDNGLAKFDNIPPKLDLSTPISDIVKSRHLSIEFIGDDGKFGSPIEYLTYEFKFSMDDTWQEAESGKIYLDDLQDAKSYQLFIRVTDEYGNFSQDTISFNVQIDTKIPIVKITNRKEFLEPIDKLKVSFLYKGKDDRTKSKDLLYSYKFKKYGQTIQNWSRWSKARKRTFRNFRSGSYSFLVKAKDKSGNESKINSVFFTIESSVDKPQVALSELNYCYFVEENSRPVLECSPIEPKITSGHISFWIEQIDSIMEKKELTYSVLLKPQMRDWSLYREDNYYEFLDLSDGTYQLNVRAKDREGRVSTTIDTTFTIEVSNQFPQTEIYFDGTFPKGKIVSTLVIFYAETNADSCLFSFKLDESDWTHFKTINSLEIPKLEDGWHTVKVLAKNEFGINPRPAVHEFEYENITDVPMIKLTSKTAKILDSNFVRFEFIGKDDQDYGDKTIADSLRYSFRLIPVECDWSEPNLITTVFYRDMKNASYFFQVKAIDKSGNESVVPAEHFFTVQVIPFYKQEWFVILLVFLTIVFAVLFSVIFTLKRTKGEIYEQRYNPYIVGEAVHDPDMFYGRDTLMHDVFQTLEKTSLYLKGERRIGKTTLLEHIDKNAQKPFFSFFCNLEAVKEEHLFSRIMLHLANKIRSIWTDENLNLLVFTKARHKYDDLDFEEDIETILQFLKKNYDPEATIIMCLDEIDAIQEFPAYIHQSLRNIFQTFQGSIRMAAAGVFIKKGNWNLPTSPWYNFFETKEVPALKMEDAELLITKPAKRFYAYDRKSVAFIMKKTDGKPFYIQMICQRAIIKILDQKRRKVTLTDVKDIYNELIHLELNREFETFWEGLSVKLQTAVIQAASSKNIDLTRKFKQELMNNEYNHGHKVIKIHNGGLKFSTIFRDWLEINDTVD